MNLAQKFVSAQDMSEYPLRGHSPQHSSSAPSTASADNNQNLIFQMSSSQEQASFNQFVLYTVLIDPIIGDLWRVI